MMGKASRGLIRQQVFCSTNKALMYVAPFKNRPSLQMPGSLGAVVCFCFLAGLSLQVMQVSAKTYSTEFCNTLRSKRAALVKAGVLGDMEKGPKWAKANLTADKIARIKRFIRLDEKVQFQCVKPRKPKPKSAGKEPAKTAAKTGKGTTRPATKSAKGKPSKGKTKPKTTKK